jgi:hypothetical protein
LHGTKVSAAIKTPPVWILLIMIMFESGGPLEAFGAAAGDDKPIDADRKACVPPTPKRIFVFVDGSNPFAQRGLGFLRGVEQRVATFEIWSAPWRKVRLPWQ